MKGGVYLSDREWMVLEGFIPKAKRRRDGKGRPRRDPREVLNGIIWILFSGSPWYLLPKEYPSYQTCHRYFQLWVRKGVMQKMLGALSLYHASGRKSTDVDVADGSFSSAKKGATKSAKQSGARVLK
ncbi:MAG TPA: transposase [Flavisolibacter sp.]|nr:transposase [Flavisolibacter sp.]